MRNLISMKRNWCAGKSEEEEDELGKNKMKKVVKQQCSWSDLDMDLLREINKKLSNYADHIRFRRVCKSWRSVGYDEKRAGDVLPWLTELCIVSYTCLYYQLQEPPLFIYDTDTILYGVIKVCDYFNDLSADNISSTIPSHKYYADGWLYISVYNLKNNSSNLLLFSLTTKASVTLPQFNHCRRHPLYIAWSTTPDSPDCVFFAMSITDIDTRTIGIFRHGDTHWTTTQSVGGLVFAKLITDDFVFIHGVFYFIITYGSKIEIPFGIGFYDLATGALNFELFSTNVKFYKVQSLGGRSLYLSTCSVYVDHINYYSTNKIYVYVGNGQTSCVDEYTLEDDGQLSICTSTRLRSLFDPWPIWVPPPDVRLRK